MSPFEQHLRAGLLSVIGKSAKYEPINTKAIIKSRAKQFVWLYLHSNLDRILEDLVKEDV